MTRRTPAVFVAGCLLLTSHSSLAIEPDPTISATHSIYSPARLVEGEGSIESLLELPEGLPEGLHVISCEARVSARGRASAFGCYSDHASQRDLLDRVERAGSKAAYKPATRSGRPIEAYMPLMVRVYVGTDSPLVIALPNNGADADKYGLAYSAPQRLTKIRWPMWWDHYAELLLWLKTSVDEQGKTSDFSLTDSSKAPVHVVKHFESQMATLEFIPGFVDRRPKAMQYVKPLYNTPP